ncbi:hypothetical protein KKB99_08045 [bacterium]|nr:hypothetical protein [bacterium]MBU1025942.1 hypothetical protein [bacterium]
MRKLISLVALLFVVSTLAGYGLPSFAEEDCPHSKDKAQSEKKSEGCHDGAAKKASAGCGEMAAGKAQTGKSECDGCGDKLCSSKMDSKANAYPSWILSSDNEINFSKSLIDYRMINGKYPADVKQLIESGLLVVWPANPVTGQPMKLVNKIEAKKEDFGKIAYVRESDNKAYFEIVISPDKKPTVYKFPCCQTVNAEMAGLEGTVKNPSALKVDSFERIMGGAFSAALSYDGFTNGKATPNTIGKAINHNFFLIKENLKPDFISADPNKSLYFEKGIATLDGELVKFGRSTIALGGCCEKDEPQIETFCWVSTVQDSDKEWVDDMNVYNRLKDKKYFYSTHEILNGGIAYDNGVLISKSEIAKS